MAKWYWMSDSGWLQFDKKKSDLLEAGYQAKTKKVAIDSERHVDLSLPYAEIVKNFTNLTDKNLVGLQRRNDDPNKRRAVKREEDTEFFSHCHFYILPSKGKKKLTKKQEELCASIKLYGGKIDDPWSAKTDYMVITEDLTFPGPAEVGAAHSQGVVLISDKWVAKSIVSQKKIDTTGFIVDLPKPPPQKEEDSEDEAPSKKSKKRKKDDEEDSKKSKKKKSEKKDEEAKIELVEATALQPGTEWMGVCTYTVEGNHYPFMLEVTKVDNEKFEGFIYWKTLNDSQTKFRGTVKEGAVKIEEYEVVQGEDEVEVPMNYSGNLKDTTVTGTVGDPNAKVTFKMDRVKGPSKVAPIVPSKWKGECVSTNSCILIVETRNDKDALTGILKYPSQNKTTKWKGKVTGNVFEFEEYELVNDDGKSDFTPNKWKGEPSADNTTLNGLISDADSFVLTIPSLASSSS